MQLNSLKIRTKVSFLIVGFLALSVAGNSQNNNWYKFPTKVNNPPRFFFVDTFTNKMIIGGEFKKVDSFITDLFLYDGSKTSFLKDNGLKTWVALTALRLNQNTLYIGGFGGLYCLKDTSWNRIDTNGGSNLIRSLYNYKNKLLIGGGFSYDSNPKKKYASISQLDNNIWVPLYGIDTILEPENNLINALVEYKNELYASGNINWLGDTMNDIIRWNNSKWTGVNGGIRGSGDQEIYDMLVYKDELYVAGRFFKNKGAVDNHIARWDGNNWHAVGGGVNGEEIYDLQVFNNELWALGWFTAAGGVPAINIAKWDGNQWCGFGNVINGLPLCAASYKNELYIGGAILSIDGDSSLAYISKWIGGNYTKDCGAISYNGIDATNIQNTFKVFPNPCSNELNIQLPESKTGMQEITLCFYNSLGQKIVAMNRKLISNAFTLDVSYLNKGLFVLEINLDNNLLRKTILKN